ncbi:MULTISPECIES: hypothetical protein [Moorena]|nr:MULTISPECIES: hypothetical protein [Moorena]
MQYSLYSPDSLPHRGRFFTFGSGIGNRESGIGNRESEPTPNPS